MRILTHNSISCFFFLSWPLLFFQLVGKWDTIAIAADNVGKIEEERELRLYTRDISCNDDCSEMDVTFYVK